MKSVLFIVMLFPLFLSAQDCKLLRDTDPYTKETKLSTGFITLQGGSFSIDADSKEVDFFFIVPDKCFDNTSSVVIYYEGTKVKATLRNGGSMTCEGNFHYTFRNSTVTPTVLYKLSTVPVTQFVFTGTDKKAVTVNVLPDQQKVLMESAACMSVQAKTLLKTP